MNRIIEIHIDYIFKFGKYKGQPMKEVIVLDDGYLEWMIENFDDLIFSPKFIEDIINTNPYFKLQEKNYEKLHTIIKKYKIYKTDCPGDNFNNYLEDKSYLKWFNLSEDEKLKRKGNYTKILDEMFNRAFYPENNKITYKNNLNSNIKSDYENNYEKESYEKYQGSYAQNVEGLSDDFIDNVLDGDPEAYWNID